MCIRIVPFQTRMNLLGRQSPFFLPAPRGLGLSITRRRRSPSLAARPLEPPRGTLPGPPREEHSADDDPRRGVPLSPRDASYDMSMASRPSSSNRSPTELSPELAGVEYPSAPSPPWPLTSGGGAGAGRRPVLRWHIQSSMVLISPPPSISRSSSPVSLGFPSIVP